MSEAQYREAGEDHQRDLSRAWRRLPINRQLLIAVNSILIVVTGVFLLLDYRVRFAHQLEQTRISLIEESKTMYESLLSVDRGGPKAIQDFIDNVCARMNTNESPGHHIAVDWGGQEYQAVSHGQASPEMMAAMRSAAGMTSGPTELADEIVVGVFGADRGTVYVSEKRSIVVDEARQSLAFHLVAVLTLAAIAALIMNAVLRHVISRPIQRMVAALGSVAEGDLSVIAGGKSCKELTFLADRIDSMTRSLEASEQDRRFHMEKARQIQQHLLPKDDELNGLKVAKLFEPAEDVGGDYFDVLALSDHKYLLCVADVTGHGVPAAMAAAVIKTIVQEAVQISQSPSQILERVNRRYTEIIMPGHLATMVALVVDTRRCTVTYANAGHEPPLLQLPTGELRVLSTADILLGVDSDVTYEEESLSVPPATKIILVSDGVTEAFDPDENLFGSERVAEFVESSAGLPVDQVVRRFVDGLDAFRRSRPAVDDTTLVVAEILGEQQDDEAQTLRTAQPFA